MKTTTKSISATCEELLKYFHDRGDGKQAFNFEFIKGKAEPQGFTWSDEPIYQRLSNALNEAEIGEDYSYEWATDALVAFSDCETVDDMEQVLNEMEGDVYTSDLTEWLNASNYHVYYLGQAASEYDLTDGFELLGMAQVLAMREIYYPIMEVVKQVAGLE